MPQGRRERGLRHRAFRTESGRDGNSGRVFLERRLIRKGRRPTREAVRTTGRHREAAKMSELDDTPRSYSGALLAAIAVALLIGIGSLIWNYNQSGSLANQQKEIDAANEQNKKLASDLRETDAHLKVATEELGNSLGLTQKQMDERAQEIVRREERNEADSQRLASAQKQTAQAVTAVSNRSEEHTSELQSLR